MNQIKKKKIQLHLILLRKPRSRRKIAASRLLLFLNCQSRDFITISTLYVINCADLALLLSFNYRDIQRALLFGYTCLMDHMKISDLTDENKPRERLVKLGPEALSDQELLAILLGSGTKSMNVIDLSAQILRISGGIAGLRKVDTKTLQSVNGIGPARSTVILASIELGRRFAKAIQKQDDRVRINNSDDVYHFKRYDMESLTHEELHILSLDTKHCLISDDTLYVGTLNSSAIRVAEIFKKPLQIGAAAFILVHNHPSGDATPSAADIITTKNVAAAGKTMDLPLLDHVIIGAGTFTSIMRLLE